MNGFHDIRPQMKRNSGSPQWYPLSLLIHASDDKEQLCKWLRNGDLNGFKDNFSKIPRQLGKAIFGHRVVI